VALWSIYQHPHFPPVPQIGTANGDQLKSALGTMKPDSLTLMIKQKLREV
jgi:hypothetical protein